MNDAPWILGISASHNGSACLLNGLFNDVLADVVELLCDGKIIGWFDGGSELGPRALGQWSILCDPRQSANNRNTCGRDRVSAQHGP